jgi:hypothetical protein
MGVVFFLLWGVGGGKKMRVVLTGCENRKHSPQECPERLTDSRGNFSSNPIILMGIVAIVSGKIQT